MPLGKNKDSIRRTKFLSEYEYKLKLGTLDLRKLNELCLWCRSNCEGVWNYNWNPDYLSVSERMTHNLYSSLGVPFDSVVFSFYYKEDRDRFALVWKGET
mgnify:CR=1 FL=1